MNFINIMKSEEDYIQNKLDIENKCKITWYTCLNELGFL